MTGGLHLEDGALVIHGPDGPTLSGSARPATIPRAELWKIGQLKSGDSVRLRPISNQQAMEMEERIEGCISELAGSLSQLPESSRCDEPLLLFGQGGKTSPAVQCRGEGDRHVLLEYAPDVPSLEARFRVQALEEQLRAAGLHGILDVQSGVRSLQVHFDARMLSRQILARALAVCEGAVVSPNTFVTPSRVIHLPLCWEAEELDDARAVAFAATYVVLVIGDGSPGAPVVIPLDARHRLHPPLRIRAAQCFVESRLAGLTVPLWNTFGTAAELPPGTPWLLRCFDQIRFFRVTAGELAEIRDLYPRGRYPLRIEHQSLKLKRPRADAPSGLQRDLPDTVVQPIDFNRPRSV